MTDEYDIQKLPLPDLETVAIDSFDFTPGELYIFYPEAAVGHADKPVWGVFDKRLGGRIYLESSSSDIAHFEMWHALPECYRRCRLSSRDELRDYFAALTLCEYRKLGRR